MTDETTNVPADASSEPAQTNQANPMPQPVATSAAPVSTETPSIALDGANAPVPQPIPEAIVEKPKPLPASAIVSAIVKPPKEMLGETPEPPPAPSKFGAPIAAPEITAAPSALENPQRATAIPATPPPAPEMTPPPILPHDDFANILEQVKLPERRDVKTRGDVPKAIETGAPEAKILEEHVTQSVDPKNLMPPTAPEKPKGENILTSSIVSPFRTLKDDLQSIVRDRKISIVRVVSLEEEKKRGQDRVVAPEQKIIRSRRFRRTTAILFTAGILVFLGAAALFGVFFIQHERNTPLPVASSSSILFAEQVVTLSLDNEIPQDLKNEIARARGQSLGANGSIAQIVPTITATTTDGTSLVRPATIAEFLHALGAHAPSELLNAIGPNFFFGIHQIDQNPPLFVIPVTSYDHAFAGMLTWESTMNADLAPAFTAVSRTTLDSNGLPEQRMFQDFILRNYDARGLEDDNGNIVLYYSFPTPNILVIGEDPNSFTEILSRLQAQQKLQ